PPGFQRLEPAEALAPATKRPPRRLNFAFVANRVRGYGGGGTADLSRCGKLNVTTVCVVSNQRTAASKTGAGASEAGSMIKTIAAGCFAVAALLTAQSPFAADLSVAPLYKAPPPVATPAYDWSGFYLGING